MLTQCHTFRTQSVYTPSKFGSIDYLFVFNFQVNKQHRVNLDSNTQDSDSTQKIKTQHILDLTLASQPAHAHTHFRIGFHIFLVNNQHLQKHTDFHTNPVQKFYNKPSHMHFSATPEACTDIFRIQSTLNKFH